MDVFSRAASRMRRDTVRSGIRELTEGDVMTHDGVSMTTWLRTACDLGRLLWRFEALGAIDGFLRLGLPQATLLGEIERFKGYRGVRQLRTLAPCGDPGAESMPESALRLHWHDEGLPWPTTQIWVHDDDGSPRFRIDLGHPETRYGAEYFGEEFHDERTHARDQGRIEWLEEQRRWNFDVFLREDVYGSELAAGPRLRAGFEAARRQLGLRATSYVDLAR